MMIVFYFLPVHGLVRFVLYMIPYLTVGYDVLLKAGKGIWNRQPFDESLLMAVATVGAMALAVYEDGSYTEAIAVMLFYQVGEWFQSCAVGKSRRNISDLMDICPEFANVEQEDGTLTQVDPDEVEVGTVIAVRPGEKIPIDGICVDGNSSVDTAALTGESVPRTVRPGDEVISGCVNQSGLLRIRTTKEYEDSTVAKVLELIEDAGSRKSKSERFITKFARVYTPIVVYAALALAIGTPLIRMALGMKPIWGIWIYRALTFLVISCPCALVISIPLSFFAGIGAISRHGVLVKGSNFLEILSNTKTLVCDKTGTLTKGVFQVTEIHPAEVSEEELIHLAAEAERYSSHPIAESLRKADAEKAKAGREGADAGKTDASGSESTEIAWDDLKEIAGEGVEAVKDGTVTAVGNARLMKKIGADWKEPEEAGTVVYAARDGKFLGSIVISDVIKEHSRQAIRALKENGVSKVVMLTGDSKKTAERVASDLKVDEVYSELLPQQKVEKLEEIMNGRKDPEKEIVSFVGDGINDAPVLTRADIGIAMGAMGSDAAVEAADVVLMDDDPLKIATAIRVSRKCLRIVRENIVFAIGVKVVCLILGALGLAGMWAAVFADVGVMILCVLNSMRCLSIRPILLEDEPKDTEEMLSEEEKRAA
ncbi:MAG: heavy metal translocating P-type ATPase [Eubacteriales bacterium]|nr:heavy metal translocating P-type ATPase [Eubacteriales bacterium]